jgi:hypothetical protein
MMKINSTTIKALLALLAILLLMASIIFYRVNLTACLLDKSQALSVAHRFLAKHSIALPDSYDVNFESDHVTIDVSWVESLLAMADIDVAAFQQKANIYFGDAIDVGVSCSSKEVISYANRVYDPTQPTLPQDSLIACLDELDVPSEFRLARVYRDGNLMHAEYARHFQDIPYYEPFSKYTIDGASCKLVKMQLIENDTYVSNTRVLNEDSAMLYAKSSIEANGTQFNPDILQAKLMIVQLFKPYPLITRLMKSFPSNVANCDETNPSSESRIAWIFLFNDTPANDQNNQQAQPVGIVIDAETGDELKVPIKKSILFADGS